MYFLDDSKYNFQGHPTNPFPNERSLKYYLLIIDKVPSSSALKKKKVSYPTQIALMQKIMVKPAESQPAEIYLVNFCQSPFHLCYQKHKEEKQI